MSPRLVQWLHILPNFGIWLVLVAINISVFLVLPIAIRTFLKIKLNDDVVKGADDAFKILIALTMALTAFALVQVEGLHRNVGDLVSREGAILLKFDRTVDDFAGAGAVTVRTPFRAYVASVIQTEWPAMARGERSADTSARLAALTAAIDQVDADGSKPVGLAGEIRGQLIQIKDVREARLSSSHMSLSPYFWSAILVAMMSLAALGWLQAPIEKAAAYLGGIVIGLSTLLTVLIVSSGIFVGEGRVAPDALARTLVLIDASAAARPTPAIPTGH